MEAIDRQREWEQGFLDGQRGVEHKPGRSEAYDNGYARGYETCERQAAIAETFEQWQRKGVMR